MGVGTPALWPPGVPYFRPKFNYNLKQIPMSQGLGQQGSIFSLSADEFERQQQINNHVAQQNRRDKLRAFEVSAAGHHPLDEAQEEASMYEPSAGTNNMLSDMFNFASPADLLAAGHSANTTINPLTANHRLIQQRRADFYGAGGNRPKGMVMSSNNWSSLHEDTAAVVAKHHGLNSDDPSSTAMRLFFMNPPAAAAAMQHNNQTFSEAGVLSFGGGVGEGILQMESQQGGPSLTLSNSALKAHLEMTKAEELTRVVRSQLGPASFFYNSREEQDDQLHPNSSIHDHTPPAAAASFQYSQQVHHHHHQSLHQSSQQVYMSYSQQVAAGSTTHLLRNSKYARATQDLLDEFCSVGRGHVRSGNTASARMNSSINNTNPARHVSRSASNATTAPASSSSSKDITPASMALSPADRFDNQRKKSKLLSMLDEVERRYSHYCEQMQMVVNSFDSVMGFGAATPYTALAQTAMSKHFRCLKDAITVQLKQTCEALGDKDGVSGSGITKGETPKLRLIDQSLRQQRAFHQLGMMEQEAWRPQRGLPDRSVTILRAWLFEHFLHPYPSDADKHLLARQTGLSRNQVSNWFINARVRLWKPMVEDMYQQEAKEEGEEEEGEDEEEQAAQHSISAAGLHSPESDAPDETLSIPRPQLDNYDHLRLSAPIYTQTLPQDHHTAADVIFPPGLLHDEMYRRAAAVLAGPPTAPSATAGQPRYGAAGAGAAARSGDLSLTLGLRHAGENAPPDAGRFGF